MSQKVGRLVQNEQLFEFEGSNAFCFMVFSCLNPICNCREILIMASFSSKEVLLERVAPVCDVYRLDQPYVDIAARLQDELLVFFFDLDSMVVSTLGPTPFSPKQSAAIAFILGNIDGKVLDAIGLLWLTLKGNANIEQYIVPFFAKTERWVKGKDLSWKGVCQGGLRRDQYLLNNKLYEADEYYCPDTDCTCGVVSIRFLCLEGTGVIYVGGVRIRLSGGERLDYENRYKTSLEQLWAAFKVRHPHYLERFASRESAMKNLGIRHSTVALKIGRNDPCICGSGKKYKKCCAPSS